MVGAHDAGAGRRSFWSGALIAVGVFALVDEMFLHLLLHWHHFYDRATIDWALFADGLFQATGLLGLVAGLFMHDALRRRGEWRGDWQLAGLLTSLGAIGLFDATVVHKLMRLHQIRYNVEFVLPDTTWYDLMAYSCAVGSLTIGLLLLARAAGGRPVQRALQSWCGRVVRRGEKSRVRASRPDGFLPLGLSPCRLPITPSR